MAQLGRIVLANLVVTASALMSPSALSDPASEREVLLTFYNATGGNNWLVNTNWDSEINHCDWHGITCDESGAVTSISLGNNQLHGFVPPELGDLNSLNILYLYSNTLTGEIPSELGQLTQLTRMDFYNNQLSGEIPSSLGNLTNPTELRLGQMGSRALSQPHLIPALT